MKFSDVFHIVPLARVGSDDFRTFLPLGTGLAAVLLGCGIIFIFRSGSQSGMIKTLAQSLTRSWRPLFLGVSIQYGVVTLSGNGLIFYIKPDLSPYKGKNVKNTFFFILKVIFIIPCGKFYHIKVDSSKDIPGSHPSYPSEAFSS